jgi:hypothetical protein
MSKITDYGALTAPAPGDVLPIVDISDFTQAGTGSTKKITISTLMPGPNVLQYGADPTGVADSAAAVNAVPQGGAIRLPAGTYLLNSSTAITLATAGTWLVGDGPGATIIKIGASFSAAQAINITAASCGVRDLSIVGTSSTVTSNPVASAIEITGAGQCAVRNTFFQYINGYAIEAVGTASVFNADLMIRGVTIRSSSGGIHLLGNTGTSFHGEHFLTDIEMQSMGATTGGAANLDGLLIEDIQDILVQGINVGVLAGTGAAVHVKGACASVSVSSPDLGGATTSTATVLIEDSALPSSPSGVKFSNGVIQGGLLGLSITGGAAHLTFTGMFFTRAQGHGVSHTGTGVDLGFYGCNFNTNNQANGTAYDFFFNSASKMTVRDCIFQTTVGAGAGNVTNPCSFTGGDVTFIGCDLRGTGTTVANAFASKPAVIRNCRNYNPVGNLSVSVPATGVAITADSMDRAFYITAGASTCSCALSGTGATILIPSGGFATIIVPARITLTPTYTAAPTWVVEGM